MPPVASAVISFLGSLRIANKIASSEHAVSIRKNGWVYHSLLVLRILRFCVCNFFGLGFRGERGKESVNTLSLSYALLKYEWNQILPIIH